MSRATSCKVTANFEGVGWEMGLKTQNLEGWGERAKLEKPFMGWGWTFLGTTQSDIFMKIVLCPLPQFIPMQTKIMLIALDKRVN